MEAPAVVGEVVGQSVQEPRCYDRKRPFGAIGVESAMFSGKNDTQSIAKGIQRLIQSLGSIGCVLECYEGVKIDWKLFLAQLLSVSRIL